jgi:hypothetical protein
VDAAEFKAALGDLGPNGDAMKVRACAAPHAGDACVRARVDGRAAGGSLGQPSHHACLWRCNSPACLPACLPVAVLCVAAAPLHLPAQDFVFQRVDGLSSSGGQLAVGPFANALVLVRNVLLGY